MNISLSLRKALLRPGTLAILVGIATFTAYNYINPPAEPASFKFEMDPAGAVRRGNRAIRVDAGQPPLWKPEPALLLQNSDRLGLSVVQRRAVELTSSAWETKRALILAAIREATGEVSTGKTTSVDNLQADLANYSGLSREFDRERRAAWERALGLLDQRQRAIAKGLAPGGAP